jgi:transcription elongation factor GreA
MKNFITKEGLEKLKKELEYLKINKRREIAQALQKAKELGDLSENAEYAEAKEAQSFNEGRIAELEEMIKSATTIKTSANQGDIVQIGSTVEIENGQMAREYTIVGSEEADPANGRISNESPLGMAFLGKKIGDEVEIETPSGKITYRILKIK